jgi:WD40 repeat protein
MGHLKLVSSRRVDLIKDFGQVHDDWITGIMATEDERFFFTSSSDGGLKQWNYQDNNLVRDHEKIMKDGIWSLCL